jgi:hypothetical protein
MYIVISHPRCGSTFLHEYTNAYNVNLGAQGITTSAEFFNSRWGTFNPIDRIFSNLNDKMQFLEKERNKGQEYSVKVQAYQVETIRPWFDEFYKDWDRLILLKKDRWRAFLSYQIQSSLKWDGRTTHNREKEMIDKLKPFLIKEEKINIWFREYNLLKDHKGIRLYHEDLNHDLLCDIFGVNIQNKFKQYELDYEPYIINLDEIKTAFHKLENNFYPH